MPEYNIGIEYDGIAYHKRLNLEDREKRKKNVLKNENIRLIRIKEDYKKQEEHNDVIYFIVDYKYSNLEFALNKLCYKISHITNQNIIFDINVDRDRQEIYKNYIAYEKKNSFATKFPELLTLWKYEKNENLIPEYFSYNSNKSVWWKCKKGHEWFETINRRNKNIACPYCSGRHKSIPLKQEQWLKNYNYAKEYFEENGNLNINAKYITKDGIKLGSWIRTQRVSYKNKI